MAMDRELTVVSNRLPLVIERDPDGNWCVEAGSGGLIQAMQPVLEAQGGRWIGWPGVTTGDDDSGREETNGDTGWRDEFDAFSRQASFDLSAIELSEEEFQGYYAGFANAVLWPLFHGFPERCDFRPEFWRVYDTINRRFAEAISEQVGDSLLWVHDYHLMLAPNYLEDAAGAGRTGFFLHIPFPGPDNFTKLPWRDDILEGLLGYDLIGLQSRRDLRNFAANIRELMPEATLEGGRRSILVERDGETTRIGVFPIGCNYDDFNDASGTGKLTQYLDHLHDNLGPHEMLLGVDRLDYTKGLLHRFKAFERALEKYPELREEVVLYQLVVPSRESVSEYRSLKQELDQMVGRIEGRFSTSEWNPIRYRYDSVSMEELTGLYRYANTGVVTPLYDGMNLVAKEYCAAQVDETGVLLLSEFAGASDQLGRDAVTVNPYDVEKTADAIRRAVLMPRKERVERMRNLRRTVSEQDVFWWAEEFLNVLAG